MNSAQDVRADLSQLARDTRDDDEFFNMAVSYGQPSRSGPSAGHANSTGASSHWTRPVETRADTTTWETNAPTTDPSHLIILSSQEEEEYVYNADDYAS